MSRRIFYNFICGAVLASALLPASLSAQDSDGAFSSFSPYTVFALGNIPMPGTAYNRSMAGVGVASGNNRYINPLNPASISSRDSLAFMVDFSLFGENRVMEQGDRVTGRNLFNIGDCIITFPIYRSAAMMVGIMPYSNTGYGYNYSYTGDVLADYGNVLFSSTGLGSIYQMFAGVGVTPLKNLSLGAEVIYYFGNIKKIDVLDYSSTDRQDINSSYSADLRGLTGKFGLQYEVKLNRKSSLGFGATYRLGTDARGYLEKNMSSTYSYSTTDTLSNTPGRLRFADELGLGVSFNYADKFRVELDYTRSDWTGTNFDTDSFFKLEGDNSFSTTVSNSIRLGAEYTPNRNDIRYYLKKVSYRAGVYHTNDYYRISGNSISSTGVTVGATLPVHRWYNGLTVALDFGRRGTMENNLVRESYMNLSLSVNLFDIWFQKPKYE